MYRGRKVLRDVTVDQIQYLHIKLRKDFRLVRKEAVFPWV